MTSNKDTPLHPRRTVADRRRKIKEAASYA